MLRSILKIVLIWFGILAVCFCVLEVCFRFFRNEPDPLAAVSQKSPQYLFTPSSSFRSLSSVPGEFDYTAHINRFGYRGKDFPIEKTKGTLRIFAVGDSFTFGVGSSDEETISALLEKDLQAEGFRVEVVNAGIGGTSPVTNYVNLRDIHLKYQPDMVVYFFDLTDLWDDWYSERHAVFGKNNDIERFDPMFVNGQRDWWITATYYSVFCRFFHNKVVRSWRKMQVLGMDKYLKAASEGRRAKAVIATQNQNASIEYDGVLFMRGHDREALIRQNWQRTEKYLTKIRDMLRARGIPLVIAMYPHGIYVDGDQWGKGRLTWGFEADRRYDDYLPFEMVRDYANRNNIPFINTLDAFLRAPKDKYFFDWDGHMTTAGNRIVAEELAHSSVLKTLVAREPSASR
ncbi:MAG: SGNH/GDSL hydrolase family protein [Candidatus Omnitrophica bacterium]|nr:SGNH/GDSL hydrolase family protein [Candidatus Omnitrophota bacterium]